MKKIRVLVVEDEIIVADNIVDTLNDLGFEALEPAINYTEAVQLIEAEKPDIAILDIQLSGKKSGIDLAEKINKEYKFPFIFLTSNADKNTLNHAKKVMPHAYLVKPFSKEGLYTTVEVVMNNFMYKKEIAKNENQVIKDTLFVKDKGAIIKIAISDILYLKSAHVYLDIVLKNNKKHVIRGSLNDIIEKLNDKFSQVHRSYIVNIDYIQKLDNNSLVIQDSIIPIGKKYKDFISKKINVINTLK